MLVVKDKKGMHHFRMKRTQSVRSVQHSKTLLNSFIGKSVLHNWPIRVDSFEDSLHTME